MVKSGCGETISEKPTNPQKRMQIIMAHYTIEKNRIVYADHTVKCAMSAYSKAYMQDMADSLNPVGTAQDHRNELFNMNNDGSWTVRKAAKSEPRRMFALVNFKQRVVLTPEGQLFDGLARTHASAFLFGTKQSALAAAQRVNSPKFTVLPVNVDAKGRPSPVTR